MTRLSLLALSAASFALVACGQPVAEDTEPAVETETSEAAETEIATEEAEPTAGPAEEEDEAAAEIAATLADVDAGSYSLDRNHAFLGFYVGHANDISKYRAGFADFDADLVFDPENPEDAELSVTVNPADLIVNYTGNFTETHPDSEFETWADELAKGDRWLNADEFPELTFTSTSITTTGPNTGEVTGDLTFLGQTQPVTLDVTYNGLTNPPWAAEQDLIGFTARTTLQRSDWGMDALIPYVGDEVTVAFSGEFKQDMPEDVPEEEDTGEE